LVRLSFGPTPFEKLMTYVFDNYSELAGICQTTHEEVDPSECADCHRDAYRPNGAPDYTCDNFRRVYVIRYLAAHTAQLRAPVSRCFGEEEAEKAVIRGASLGGGPGVEAIALINQLANSETNHTVVFHNFDRERSWKSMYLDLVEKLAENTESISVSPEFHELNSPIVRFKPPDLKPYDIMFISWILSELDDQETRSRLLAQSLLAVCDRGYIIIADRTEQTLNSEISRFAEGTAGCDIVDCELQHAGNCHIDFPGEAIWDVFGPKASYTTAYWVLQKV